MAEEAVNFEPESKRPRISLEPSETKLLPGTDNQASEEHNDKLSSCVQRTDTEGKKLENASLTAAEHVVEAQDKVIKGETNLEDGPPVRESPKRGPDTLKHASASEKDVGILEFVSNLPGFHGVLKQRYTDFIVSERDLQGNLVRLSDTSIPQEEKSIEFDLDILSVEEKEKIQQVVDDQEKKASVILSPDNDKEHRRLVHRAIRENFSSLGKNIFLIDSIMREVVESHSHYYLFLLIQLTLDNSNIQGKLKNFGVIRSLSYQG